MRPYRAAFREEATVLRTIHGRISEICDAQGKLSKVMEAMIGFGRCQGAGIDVVELAMLSTI